MTKEITKAFILQQMQDKFKLRELLPERFRFSEEVVPVYNVEQHLHQGVVEYKSVSITSGPSGYLYFTVPENEKWALHTYNVVFVGAGAYTVTGLYLLRAASVAGRSIYLDMTLGQSVSYSVNLPKSVPLWPGDQLYLYVDSYTSTAALRLYADVVKETIR